MNSNVKPLIALFSAFLIWGGFPIFVRFMGALRPDEFLYVRITFSVILLFILFAIKRQLSLVFLTILKPRFLICSAITGVLIAMNWFFYIVAVNWNLTTQASLGYFMTPLINVLFATLFLKEKLNRWTIAAITLASVGILYQVISLHIMPWLSLGIGASFGVYGGLRKLFKAPAIIGLFSELLILMPIVLIAWAWLDIEGKSFHYIEHPYMIALIFMAGLLTILPLMLFLYAVQYLPLTTVGLAQYSTPTIQFMIAILYFKEPFDIHRLIAFLFIWSGLIIYTSNLLWKQRRTPS